MSAEVPLHVIARVARELEATGEIDNLGGRSFTGDHERAVQAVIRELAMQGYEVRARAP